MQKDEIISSIKMLSQGLLDNPMNMSLDDFRYSRDARWDSVARVSLIDALESKFDIVFKINEVSSWDSIDDLANIILSKVA